jgi:hypothetical protein
VIAQVNRRDALIVLRIITFVALFPISVRLADSLFTQPFQAGLIHPVLLVWPDRVEMQWFNSLSEVSPLAADANYSYSVPPERESWVKAKVRDTPSPNGNAVWIIQVKQLGAGEQEIRLELMGDGITGIIYEATSNRITPLHTLRAGPLDSIKVLLVHLSVWGAIWLAFSLVTWRVNARGRLRMSS